MVSTPRENYPPPTNSSVVVAPMLPIFSFHTCCTPPLTCPLAWGNVDHPDPGAITTETEGTGSPANFCELGNRSIMLFVSDYSAQIGERSIVMSVSVCACVFVCPRWYLRKYTSDLHHIFCACYLWQCLSSGGVFIDVVIFSHKLRLLDESARLRQWGSRSLAWHWLGPLQRSWRLRLLLAVRAN